MSSDVYRELNPVLVAQVDAFAEMVEQRNIARDAAICLEQELAAAEAEAVKVREMWAHLRSELAQTAVHGVFSGYDWLRHYDNQFDARWES